MAEKLYLDFEHLIMPQRKHFLVTRFFKKSPGFEIIRLYSNIYFHSLSPGLPILSNANNLILPLVGLEGAVKMFLSNEKSLAIEVYMKD